MKEWILFFLQLSGIGLAMYILIHVLIMLLKELIKTEIEIKEIWKDLWEDISEKKECEDDDFIYSDSEVVRNIVEAIESIEPIVEYKCLNCNTILKNYHIVKNIIMTKAICCPECDSDKGFVKVEREVK